MKSATRGPNLLDLVMTDLKAKATVGGKIQDHAFVVVETSFALPRSVELSRAVWNYGKADWELLYDSLEYENWEILRTLDPNECAAALTSKIMELAESSIGRRMVKETKSNHPWMTQEIKECIKEKHAAEGTPNETSMAERCS